MTNINNINNITNVTNVSNIIYKESLKTKELFLSY